jgi:hypothetical protein
LANLVRLWASHSVHRTVPDPALRLARSAIGKNQPASNACRLVVQPSRIKRTSQSHNTIVMAGVSTGAAITVSHSLSHLRDCRHMCAVECAGTAHHLATEWGVSAHSSKANELALKVCGRGWSPDHYENWLSHTLTLLLLPTQPGTTGPSN